MPDSIIDILSEAEEDDGDNATPPTNSTTKKTTSKVSALDKENTQQALSLEEKLEAAEAIDYTALTMANISIAYQTSVRRTALIDAQKTQTAFRLAKERRRLLELKLELVEVKAAGEKEKAEREKARAEQQQNFESEKSRLMKDIAVAQASMKAQAEQLAKDMGN